MDLQEKGWDTTDWIHLGQTGDQRQFVAKTVTKLHVPSSMRNFFKCFSRSILPCGVGWLLVEI
jgi:hypothetical protein